MDNQKQYDELYNRMKELLSDEAPDHDEVKTVAGNILSLRRSFPPDLRFRIWEVLLDVSEREEPDFDLMIKMQTKFDEDNVVKQDVNRSFNTVEEFRRSELQKQLTVLIAIYCAKYGVAYWQGMHEIIATFLLIEPQPPLSRVFLVFSAFLQTFIPHPMNDNDCTLLNHYFEIIRLLLQYHDPQLAIHLENNMVEPNIYSISMILTIFAHDVCQPLLLSIWDQYIFYKNPTIHIFTIVHALITNKPLLLAYQSSDLYNFVTHLPFENDEDSIIQQVRHPHSLPTSPEENDSSTKPHTPRKCDPSIITDLVAGGIRLMQSTPPGFIHRLNDILNDQVTLSTETLKSYCNTPCITSSPAEILTYLVRGIEKNVNCLHYLLLDTRPPELFKKGHLTNSKNVNSKTLINLEKLDILVRKARDHSSHVVILAGDDAQQEKSLSLQMIETLVKRGCRYVSQVVGGYDRVVKLLKQDDMIKLEDLISADDVQKVKESQSQSQPQPSMKEPEEEKREMVKQINGRQCLLYANWFSNPHVKVYACKKVQKVTREGKEVFVSTGEKKMVFTNGFLFVIDIDSCPEKDYAIIESKYNYTQIESVKEAGKEYIFMIALSSKEGQKRKMLFNVENRDECIEEFKNRMN